MPEMRFTEFPEFSDDPRVGVWDRYFIIFLTYDIKND